MDSKQQSQPAHPQQQQPLSQHQNLEIEDILDKLHAVTSESNPNFVQLDEQHLG